MGFVSFELAAPVLKNLAGVSESCFIPSITDILYQIRLSDHEMILS